MTQGVRFLVVLFALTWPWGYVARPLFASGSVGMLLVGLLPSVWAPTVVAVLLLSVTGGAREVRKELTAIRPSPRPCFLNEAVWATSGQSGLPDGGVGNVSHPEPLDTW